MTQKKITLEQIKKDYQEHSICMAELLSSTPAEGLSVEEAFYLFIEALQYSDSDRFFWMRDKDEIEELGAVNTEHQYINLLLRRYENLDKLKEDIQSNGSEVISIAQANEAEDIDVRGILYPDSSLIVNIKSGDGNHSTLTLFYYIDRYGQIVITQTYCVDQS